MFCYYSIYWLQQSNNKSQRWTFQVPFTHNPSYLRSQYEWWLVFYDCSIIVTESVQITNSFRSIKYIPLWHVLNTIENHISDKGFLSLYPSLLTMNLISLNLSSILLLYLSILDLLLTKQSILYMCEHPIKSLQYLYLDSILLSGCVLK